MGFSVSLALVLGWSCTVRKWGDTYGTMRCTGMFWNLGFWLAERGFDLNSVGPKSVESSDLFKSNTQIYPLGQAGTNKTASLSECKWFWGKVMHSSHQKHPSTACLNTTLPPGSTVRTVQLINMIEAPHSRLATCYLLEWKFNASIQKQPYSQNMKDS